MTSVRLVVLGFLISVETTAFLDDTIGVPMLVIAARAAIIACNSDRLARKGVFAWTRNPIDSAWIAFRIPRGSWSLFLTSIVAHMNFQARIGRENGYLEKRLGDDDRKYKAQVNGFVPFPRTKHE